MSKSPVINKIPTNQQVQEAISKSNLTGTKAEKLKAQIDSRIKYQQDYAKNLVKMKLTVKDLKDL